MLHNRSSLPDPILAQLWRLGSDEGGAPSVTYLTSLPQHHAGDVNCVRFSPSGMPGIHMDA
jgi:hypothetical protein